MRRMVVNVDEIERREAIYQRFSLFAFKNLWSILSLDPFLICRVGNETFKKIYQPLWVKYKWSTVEERAKRWRIIFYSYMIYTSIKMFSIMLIQLVIYLYKKRNYCRFREFNSLVRFSEIIGNPFSAGPGISFSIYSVNASVLVLEVSASYYFSKNPMDAPLLRYLIEPKYELRRVDLLVTEHLGCLVDAIQLRLSSRNDVSDPTGPTEINKGESLKLLPYANVCNRQHQIRWQVPWDMSKIYLETQLRYIRAQHVCLSIMRPPLYRKWIASHIHKAALYIGIFCSVFGLSVAIIFVISLLFVLMKEKCKLHFIETCTLSAAYSLSDLLTLVELFLALFVNSIIASVMLSVLFAYFYSHIIMSIKLKKNLQNCLTYIAEENSKFIDSLTERLYSVRNPKVSRRIYVKVLRMSIKLRLSEIEVKKSAVFLSDLMSTGLLFVGLGVSVTILSSSMSELDLMIYRTVILGIIWVGANIYFIACAYYHARVAELEKSIWSILAQLMLRISLEERPYYDDTIFINFQRLAHSYRYSRDESSIRPFGLILTFGRVLQLNFYIVSIASLVS